MNTLSSFPVHIFKGVHSLTAQRKLVNIIHERFSPLLFAFCFFGFFFFRFDQIWKINQEPLHLFTLFTNRASCCCLFLPRRVWYECVWEIYAKDWFEKRKELFFVFLSRRENKCSPKFVPRGSQHHLVDIKRKKEGENIFPSGVSSLSLRNQSTVNRRKAMQFRAGIWRRSSGCCPHPPISYMRLLLRSTVST